MSTEREEPAHLVEEIPEEQVPRALADMRKHLRPARKRTWPPAWFASAPGSGDAVGAHSDEHLAEGFGQH